MESSKPSLGSTKVAQEVSPSASRSTRRSPTSPDGPNPNPPKSLQRDLSSKTVPSPDQQRVKVCDVQQHPVQAQEEAKMAREEKSQPLEELKEMKRALTNESEKCERQARIRVLEDEVEKTKKSERKMLESLASQTKQLEQAKIELEEAKLEIRNLQGTVRELEHLRRPRSSNLLRLVEKPLSSASAQSQEEVTRLKGEIKLAIEAEEKSKKAMDSLASALKEVTMEANRMKGKLSIAQSESVRARAEADQLKPLLKANEDKFQTVSAEVEQLRREADESASAWSAKEKVFISCIKVSEEEAAKVVEENRRLLESQQAAKEENSKLRDIMKQALNEASVVKTGLEIARKENSQLKSLLSEKENALETMKQEYGCPLVSQAAALQGDKELKSFPSASISRCKSARLVDYEPLIGPEAMEKQGTRRKLMTKSPSEHWRNDGLHMQNGQRVPDARTNSFHGFRSGRMVSSGRKDSVYGSLGCVSDMTVPSLRKKGNLMALNSEDSCHAERIRLHGTSNMESVSAAKQKRKQILRKFDELLRRKNLHNYERVI